MVVVAYRVCLSRKDFIVALWRLVSGLEKFLGMVPMPSL
jgi:hypothetical protein